MNFDLHQTLRYGASGGFGLAVLFSAHNLPIKRLRADYDFIFSEWTIILFAFLVGAIIYSIYRSVILPLIYMFAILLSGRNESVDEIDVERWKRMKNSESMQKFMYEWGGHIHLLNTCGLSGLAFLSFGRFLLLDKSSLWQFSLSLSFGLIIVSLFSNVRYQIREKHIADVERKID